MKKDATEIHAQMQRLYQAAKDLHKKEKKADVARLLDVSDQLLNTWEKRGISSGRQPDMARMLGCGLAWLREGAGDMLDNVGTTQGNLQDVVDLITCYGRLPHPDRDLVLRFARSLLREE